MVTFAVNTSMITAKGESVVDAIESAAEMGIEAIEFFDWENVDLKRVRETAEQHEVAIACILGGGSAANIDDRDRPAITDPYDHSTAVADVNRTLHAASDVGAESIILTVGPDQGGFERETQRRAIERVLREIVPTAEQLGVTALIEPLNVKIDHQGYFLASSREACDIVRSVGSTHVKVLFDIYHQQITEGDVIRNLTENSDSVGHVHIADNPGRTEPGSGEIAYPRVLDALDDAGYDSYVGLEFFSASEETTMQEAIESTLELAQ